MFGFFGMFLHSHQVFHHVFTRSTHETSSGNLTKLWKTAQLQLISNLYVVDLPIEDGDSP